MTGSSQRRRPVRHLHGRSYKGPLQHVLGPGDTLVVCKLYRLARSTSDLLKIAEELDKLGASFEVLNTNLDTVLYHSELVEYQASRWH
ncbi:recombinase family protein [Marinobacter sp.]|uniref:recombinase family protein n=1 Tax=Marinobacter sp. TaxID=50741 RepID=UPI003A92184C